MEKTKLWALKSLDLSQLGGPMGTERVSTNYVKYFTKKIYAKQFAEKEYAKKRPTHKIDWCYNKGMGSTLSGDLGFVEYHIYTCKIEK